jgi:hypothetical protein
MQFETGQTKMNEIIENDSHSEINSKKTKKKGGTAK